MLLVTIVVAQDHVLILKLEKTLNINHYRNINYLIL